MMTSITIESLQFAFSVGAMDIDDVILNTSGGMVGYGLFRIMKQLLKSFKYRFYI